MAGELICLDTSVLIDYFRKTEKKNSFFFDLTNRYADFSISVITEFEILGGCNDVQKTFWNELFKGFAILPFDQKASQEAVRIFHELKPAGNLIEMPDLFIGAIAKANGLKLATLNEKHFARIKGLELIVKP